MAKTPVADEKKYLRAILKETRQSLTASFVEAASSRVQSAFLHSELYPQAGAIVLYAALGTEVSTEAVFADALSSGRKVFFPRVDYHHKSLSLCRVTSRADLVAGTYGILEPVTPAIETSALPPSVVVVPGLAFTANCERIGRGGGHYDRMLAELPSHAISVGLAYSFQLLDEIPQSRWDQRLNFVVTESAIYRAPAAIGRESGIRQGGIPR